MTLSYRNVSRLTDGKIKPEYISEAIEEIEAEFNRAASVALEGLWQECKLTLKNFVTQCRQNIPDMN
jgi:hypothetical protein